MLGIHTVTTGLPVLLDEMKKAGREVELPPLTPEQERAEGDFHRRSRLLEPTCGTGCCASRPSFFGGLYGILVGAGHGTTGTFETKVRELIYIAIDSAYHPPL